jgi:hypothetical protein
LDGGRKAGPFGDVGQAEGVGGVEDFFRGQGVAFLQVGEDGRFDEVALVVSPAGEAVAAAEGFAVFFAADVEARLHAVAYLELFGALDEGGDEFIVDGGFDDGAAGGRALLAGGEEGRVDDVFDGGVEVAVGEDDGGILAAHFKLEAEVALRTFGMDPIADFDGAGEGDGLDGLGVDEGAGDEVDNAGGDAGFMTGFDEAPGAEGGDAGGLDDDRVVADEGGGGPPPPFQLEA